ncbi:hypothetical protein [Sorangium sp. So ce1335]
MRVEKGGREAWAAQGPLALEERGALLGQPALEEWEALGLPALEEGR